MLTELHRFFWAIVLTGTVVVIAAAVSEILGR